MTDEHLSAGMVELRTERQECRYQVVIEEIVGFVWVVLVWLMLFYGVWPIAELLIEGGV